MASASTTDSAPSIDSAPAIGIDLGTTYSCVGVFRNGTVEIIANNDNGNRTTPSCVAFTDADCYVGEAAKLQMATNPTNTVFSAKRLFGRSFRDYSVQSDLYCWPFEVVEQGNQPRIRVEHKRVSRTLYPQEISAMVLTKMKEVAQYYLGPTVTKAVVTVPANFNNSQRQATKDAARIAGLDVLRIINEPTAAAIAYGLIREKRLMGPEKRSLLVFDLGGGTLDVSVVTIKEGVYEVIATAGDTQLGGDNFDIRMVEHFAVEFKEKHGADLTACKRAMCQLRMACETAKRTLSWNTHAYINIACLFNGVDFRSTIKRKTFEDLNADLFSKSVELVEKALRDANKEKAAVDDIVVVGGSACIPKIQQLLRDFFGGKELCKDINPDEAVAYGAAVQAAILNGDQFDHLREFRLQDVAPLSLGTDVDILKMHVVIKRNTPIPTRCTKEYTTMSENQANMIIEVYEGEHLLTKDNNLLGKFNLNGIKIAPKCETTVDITFDVDSNGILKVSAVDKSSGANNQLTITNDEGRLSEEEIRRMVRDAEKFKEEDEEQRSCISDMNALESCALSLQTTVESCALSLQTTVESGKVEGKVSKSYRKKFLNKVNGTLKWFERNKREENDEFKGRPPIIF